MVTVVTRTTVTRATLLAVAFLAGAGCSQASSSHPAGPASTRPPTTLAPPSTSGPDPTSTAPTGVTPTPVPAAPGPAVPPSSIVVGPGAQAHYTVQPQPAPGTCRYTYVGADPLPDPHCTPGAVNPQVTQADLATTICASGFTATIRPPESITGPEKVGSAAAYGYTGSLHVAEYDHLISLELGGDPNDAANLWVQPPDNPDATTVANTKDKLENRLNSLVCSGQLTLAAAQQAIAGNWVAAYQQFG